MGRGGGHAAGSSGPGKSHKASFVPHLSKEAMDAGLQAGTFVKGQLRINRFNRREAYVSCPTFKHDIFLDGEVARNRALEGDIVVVLVDEDKSRWRRRDRAPVARVAAVFSDVGESSAPDSDLEETLPHSDVSSMLEEEEEEEEQIAMDRHIPRETFFTPSKLAQLQGEDEEDEDGYDAEVESATKSRPRKGSHDAEEVGGYLDEDENEEADTILEKLESRLAEISLKQEEQNPVSDAVPSLTVSGSEGQPRPVVEDDPDLQPSGKVVGIYERRSNSVMVGFIRSGRRDGGFREDDRYVNFEPMDKRMPFMIIPVRTLPPDFMRDPEKYRAHMFSAELDSWEADHRRPRGRLLDLLGEAGRIDVEIKAILLDHDCDHGPFPEEVLEELAPFAPKEGESWAIPAEEYSKRRDLRSYRIFTIDPITARDLDDAIHVIPLEDGTFEVGVHIADVSHFVQDGTALDQEAQRRSTTVYLVNQAITMLPSLLSAELCSLNPHTPRLCYSCIFRMTADGLIIEDEEGERAPWYGRSIIQTCCRLHYGLVQDVIEGTITKDNWPEEFLPTDGHTVPQVIESIFAMQHLAQARRADRFAKGALRLERPKVAFTLDADGEPDSVYPYVTKDSNKLVEEFMLGANYLVGKFLTKWGGESCLLRRHEPPQERKLAAFLEFCQEHNINIRADSAGSLYQSLRAAAEELAPRIPSAPMVLEYMATRTMCQAEYICTHELAPENWKHYALNMPYYTHFTSPIRRYPDIIVHRMLTWALMNKAAHDQQKEIEAAGNAEAPELLPLDPAPYGDSTALSELCRHCNEKKRSSRLAQEHSDKLFLCVLARGRPIRTKGVILQRSDHNVVVVSQELGLEGMCYLEDSLDFDSASQAEKNGPVTITYKSGKERTLDIFDEVEMEISQKPNKLPIQLHYVLL